MPQLAYRSRVHADYEPQNLISKTCSYPPGWQPGDLLVAQANGIGELEASAGWTKARPAGALASGGGYTTQGFYRIAQAGDTPSLTVTGAQATAMQVNMVCYVGPAAVRTSDLYGKPASDFTMPYPNLYVNGTIPAETTIVRLGWTNNGRSQQDPLNEHTPPPGHTERYDRSGAYGSFTGTGCDIYHASATSAGPDQFVTGSMQFGSGTGAVAVAAYRVNTPPTAPGTPTVTPNPVNTTGTIAWGASTDAEGDPIQYWVDLSTDNGVSYSRIVNNLTGTSTSYDFTNVPSTTVARVRVLAGKNPDDGVYSAWTQSAAFTVQHNRPPTAPSRTAPADNSVLDRAAPQTFSWTHNDPDTGDGQSKYDFEYRTAGSTGGWTVNTVTTTVQSRVVVAGTFAAGNYEWRVRTYDSQGVASPYSSTGYFTAAVAPSAPTITAPANNATVGQQDGAVAWSVPSQEAYRVRKVADNAGAPNTASVLYDSGELTSATARNAGLSFPVNNRAEHLQVQIRSGGLWSSWASVRVTVSYTRPQTPSLTLQALAGGLVRVTPVATPENLLSGQVASAESGSAGWTVNNAALSQSTAQKFQGAASFAVTASAAGNVDLYLLPAERPAVAPGRVYTLSVQLRAGSTARQVEARVYWKRADGSTISTWYSARVGAHPFGWAQVQLTAMAPEGAVAADVGIAWYGLAAGEVQHFDAVALVETPSGNLAPNPSVDDGAVTLTGPNGSTVALSQARAWIGSSSALVTMPAAGITAVGVALLNRSDLMPSTTYTFSCYVWVPTGTVDVTLSAQGSGVASTSTAGAESRTSVKNAWVRLVGQFTTGPTSGGVALYVLNNANTTAGQTFHVDAVQLVVGATALPFVPPTRVNLFPNPSAEVNTTGWEVFGSGTRVRSTERARYGTASVRYTGSLGNRSFLGWDTRVEAGRSYVASAWVYLASGAFDGLRLEWLNEGRTGTVAQTAGTLPSIPVGQWTRVTISGVAPAAGSPWVRLVLQSTTSPALDAWVDAVQVELGTVASEYFDGSSGNGYVWEASENHLSAAASSFEDGTLGGWVASTNATGLANSTAFALSGTRSLTFSAVADASVTQVRTAHNTTRVVPGTVITASAHVRGGTVARSAQLYLVWYDAAGVALPGLDTTGPVESGSATAFVRHTVTAVVPDGAAAVTLLIRVRDALAGEAFYFDAVQIEQRPYATPFASTGAAHASPSRQEAPWTEGGVRIAAYDIFRRELGELGPGVRVAAGATREFEDGTVAHRQEYEYLVRAHATNGTSSDSPWTA